MAFTFGASATPAPATPAPAGGGFSFGGTTPAPAPAGGGFSFGGTTPAPATPAPAPTAFGGFGGTPAPAPTGGFGSFGATPAPAPSGGLFGTTAPAPATGFGAPAAPVAPVAPSNALAGHVPYASLQPDHKRAIDTLYQAMMQHKRTVLQVSTMAPKLLQKTSESQQADAAVGEELPLPLHIRKLSTQVQHLQQELQIVRQKIDETQKQYENSTTQAYMYAKWPTEAVAMRRQVNLTPTTNESLDADLQTKLRQLLDREMVHVDRVERMPSPYLWQLLEEMEQRLIALKVQMNSFQLALEQSKKQIPSDHVNVTAIVKLQEQSIWKIASTISMLNARMNDIRNAYRNAEKENNVLDAADQELLERKQGVDQQMRLQMVKTLPVKSAAAPAGSFASSPAPGGLFGKAPASGGGLFGSTPAPAGGFFGSTPAPAFGTPAPSIFGSTPAPAPAFGAPAPAFSFGSTPAPAPAFGAAPTPAPGFGFGASSSSSTPKAKNKGRSTRRR